MLVRAGNDNGSECFEIMQWGYKFTSEFKKSLNEAFAHDLTSSFLRPTIRWCWADARPLDLILKSKGCHLTKSTGSNITPLYFKNSTEVLCENGWEQGDQS